MQRNVPAGDGGGPGSSVGAQHVAVDGHRVFSQSRHVGNRSQGASGQALDFLGSAGWASAGNLSSDPFVGGPRQHCVLGGYPSHAAASAPAGNARRHGGGADDVCVPHLDQCRPLSLGHEPWSDFHRSKFAQPYGHPPALRVRRDQVAMAVMGRGSGACVIDSFRANSWARRGPLARCTLRICRSAGPGGQSGPSLDCRRIF